MSSSVTASSSPSSASSCLKVVPKVSAGLQRMVPRLSPTAALIAACAGVFYVVDILGERLMTVAGWYSYVEPVGLAWTSDRGSLSFVWPAIPFLLFAVFITLTLREDENGNYPNEKFFRVAHAWLPDGDASSPGSRSGSPR